MRVAYLYFMTDNPEGVRAVAPEHAAYRRGMAAPGYQGGPFADRSGGLITFETVATDEAEQLVANDPFLRNGLVQAHWLKEWTID